MPVSLARRIRRIGLLVSTKDEKGNRVHNFDPALDDAAKAGIVATLRADAKAARKQSQAKQREAEKKHKARVKAGRKGKAAPVATVATPAAPAKTKAAK